ncbi:MAG: hypothetical protein IIC95_01245 [Chloroflexi bacterium]|nr:hypothetical protein [Chloroflexota bacterium]
MALAQPVRDGVENLIRNCVGVAKGEAILLLNERGGVDADLVALMEESIVAGGGTAYSLWIEPLTGIKELPAVVGSAVTAADKLVLNANLNRVVLLEHLRAHDRTDLVRVNNRARAADAIATEHATFDWRLVIALAERVERVTAAASAWSITSPHGTDMRGRVASGSEVADAFFAQDADTGRTERVFPGEVYSPVGSADANGVIAFDHPGFADKERFANPMMLTVADSVVTDIAWREEGARPGARDDATGNTVWTREQLVALLDANAERYGKDRAYVVDSWHGGMHPKAVRRGGQQSNQDTMHFHVGRVPAALSAYVSDQTIELDGVPFWVNGRSTLLDEPEIKAMAAEYGATI